MSTRHFLLYDFLVPIFGILAAGFFLSSHFDTSLFLWIDSVKVFGIGAWFSHSPIRQTLWIYSWAVFAAAPALLWMVWFRVNLEYDWVERSRRLDRPIYNFVRGFCRWIDGVDASKWQMQSLQFRTAQAEDRARKLEADLVQARKAYSDLEADYDDLEAQLAPTDEMESEYAQDSRAG
jgi:signal transduction histidine kinase